MLSKKPWRAEAVTQLCARQIACVCLGTVAIGLLHKLGIRGFNHNENFGTIVVGTLCFQGASWVLISFFLRQHQTGWREAFGFRGPRLKHALLTAVGFIIVVLPVVLLLQGASIHALEKFGWPPEDQAAVKLVTDAKSLWTTIYLGVFAVVIAPVAEEFIFRGMLFPFVKQLGWPRLAWLGVSFLFALIHLNAPTFVPLFAFALALTWLYEKTDNLLAPITAHALFNAANFGLLLWQNQHPQA
ncbi:MAG TPA: CPBP family intramembrane glutamic endopeptidase [Verrucomicrobiae bacterium]|jgi:membrane protease YdiL (CAAX protease family)|nr:CPBP family intramembrane glutamic endopeptidase [Verrucomicrobiae bacterium]